MQRSQEIQEDKRLLDSCECSVCDLCIFVCACVIHMHLRVYIYVYYPFDEFEAILEQSIIILSLLDEYFNTLVLTDILCPFRVQVIITALVKPDCNGQGNWYRLTTPQPVSNIVSLTYFQIQPIETLYNTVNFCWSTHKRHSIARPKGRGMGCLLWVQRATCCVDLSKLSSIKYLL